MFHTPTDTQQTCSKPRPGSPIFLGAVLQNKLEASLRLLEVGTKGLFPLEQYETLQAEAKLPPDARELRRHTDLSHLLQL